MSTLVVTMAGEARRFRDMGIRTPKWALRVGGTSMLERSLTSMSELLDAGWHLVLVALESHIDSEAWRGSLAGLRWAYDVVSLPATPHGQAYSAVAASRIVDGTEPIAIWNIDTLILPGIEPLGKDSGNWLTLTQSPGDHWSFAELDPCLNVVRTSEKIRISPYTSIGLYGFSSMGLFAELIRREESVVTPGSGELYIAPLYNHLVMDGRSVSALALPVERLFPFGTPDEVVSSCRRLGWAVPAELLPLAETTSAVAPPPVDIGGG